MPTFSKNVHLAEAKPCVPDPGCFVVGMVCGVKTGHSVRSCPEKVQKTSARLLGFIKTCNPSIDLGTFSEEVFLARVLNSMFGVLCCLGVAGAHLEGLGASRKASLGPLSVSLGGSWPRLGGLWAALRRHTVL